MQIHHRALYVLCRVCMCKMCPKAQKAEKELNRQKNVPSHKGPSFLCFVSVSQSVTSFEEWNCHLFLVGLVAETGGGWLELKLLPLRAQRPTARSPSEAEWDLVPIVPLPSLAHCSPQECLRSRAGSLFHRRVPGTHREVGRPPSHSLLHTALLGVPPCLLAESPDS